MSLPRRVALHRGGVAVDVPRLPVLRGRGAELIHEPEVAAQIVLEAPDREQVRGALRWIAQKDRVRHRRGRAHDAERVVVDDRVGDERRLHALDRGFPRELELVGRGVQLRVLALIARGRVAGALEQLRHRRVGIGPLDENARRLETIGARGVGRISRGLGAAAVRVVRGVPGILPAVRVLGGQLDRGLRERGRGGQREGTQNPPYDHTAACASSAASRRRRRR